MAQDERAVLRVEGKDDKYVIENLLSRHGIDHTVVDIRWSKQGDDDGGKDRLLEGMRLAVTTSTGRAVGFVLDADSAPGNRWRGVRTADRGLARRRRGISQMAGSAHLDGPGVAENASEIISSLIGPTASFRFSRTGCFH